MATSIVWSRGCEWCSSCLHDGWGDNVSDDEIDQLADLVVGRFEALARQSGRYLYWEPRTSEVIGDQDQPAFEDGGLDALREQAIQEVWQAVIGDGGPMEQEVTHIFDSPEHLWVVEWMKTDLVPSPNLSPEFPEAMVVVADTHFVLVRGKYDDVETVIRGYTYWRNNGHPLTGRWLGAGGDEVYVARGRIVTTLEEVADDLGLDLDNFGANTWDEVDPDLLADYIPTF